MSKSISQHFGQLSKMATGSKVVQWLMPFAIFLLAFLLQRSVALLGLDLHHDAFMFDASKRLLEGEKPFRDFFYQYNLATVFFHALSLKTFGIYISSLKIATCLVYALIATLIYLCALVLDRPLQGLGMALIWSTLSPFYLPMMNGFHAWSTVYMMASVMAGIFFLILGMRRAPLYALLAGACFCLAFWFKQVAAIQILAALLWLLVGLQTKFSSNPDAGRSRGVLIWFILGGVITALPFAYYLQSNGLIVDWWRSAFEFNKLFASTGGSSAGLKEFMKNFLPIQRDLGYKTYIWLLLPVYVVIMALGGATTGGVLLSRSDEKSRYASLLVLMGLAGWIEYFPLSHAFHTQLFMAPAFCLIALGMHDHGTPALGWSPRRLVRPFMLILALALAYDVFQHMKGLRVKVAQTRIVLNQDFPARGIRLLPEYADSFNKYYRATESISANIENSHAIPASTDPLRAIFPKLYSNYSPFNMGVDWTWPNEIVEPGFNQKRSELIRERHYPIYGDGIVAIAGYYPAALLEMPSPLGIYHTLYLPSADKEAQDAPSLQISRIIQLGYTLGRDAVTNHPNEANLRCGSPMFSNEVLIPYGEMPSAVLENVEALHVSVISDFEFAKQFSELEYKDFIVPAMAVFEQKVSADHFFMQYSNGKFALRDSLSETDWSYLARFFLSRGKLYNSRFVSTLAQSEKEQPVFAVRPKGEECVHVVWSRTRGYVGESAKGEDIYVAIPDNRLADGGPMTFFVQAVLKDKTTYSKYLRYGFEGSGGPASN